MVDNFTHERVNMPIMSSLSHKWQISLVMCSTRPSANISTWHLLIKIWFNALILSLIFLASQVSSAVRYPNCWKMAALATQTSTERASHKLRKTSSSPSRWMISTGTGPNLEWASLHTWPPSPEQRDSGSMHLWVWTAPLYREGTHRTQKSSELNESSLPPPHPSVDPLANTALTPALTATRSSVLPTDLRFMCDDRIVERDPMPATYATKPLDMPSASASIAPSTVRRDRSIANSAVKLSRGLRLCPRTCWFTQTPDRTPASTAARGSTRNQTWRNTRTFTQVRDSGTTDKCCLPNNPTQYRQPGNRHTFCMKFWLVTIKTSQANCLLNSSTIRIALMPRGALGALTQCS